MTYRLGWSIVPQMLIERERWSGGHTDQGIPLVSPGQYVLPDQPVLRIEPSEAIKAMQSNLHFPLPSAPDNPSDFDEELPAGGTDSGTQHRRGRGGETFPAGLRGRVVSITPRGGVVIESPATVVQGAIGTGSQVVGVLTMWRTSLVGPTGKLTVPPGALLVVPGPVNFALLRQASISGVVGLIASSVALRDLEGFLQTDVIQLLHSADIEAAQAKLPKISLLFTEGSGNIAMPARTINLLSHYQGSIALLSGATSVKQRIVPELAISLPPQEAEQHWHPHRPDTTLKVGVRVRICSGDYVGMMGEVDYLFTHQHLFSSGAQTRAARLRLDNGSLLVMPLTGIERVS